MSNEVAKIEPKTWVSSLLTPTPDNFVKSREVGGDRKADYVEGGYVKGRLLEISDGKFSFSWEPFLVSNIETSNIVMVKARLTVETPDRYPSCVEDVGIGFIKGATTQEAIETAVKGAVTDGLKRCCTFFGIALDLYSAGIYDNPKEKEDLVLLVPEHLQDKARQMKLKDLKRFIHNYKQITDLEAEIREKTRDWKEEDIARLEATIKAIKKQDSGKVVRDLINLKEKL